MKFPIETISASGTGGLCDSDHVAVGVGARLPGAAVRIIVPYAPPVPGHHRSPVSSMGIGAAPPIHHHRESARRRRHNRDRSSGTGISGRIPSSLYSYGERYQRHTCEEFEL